MDQHFPDIRQNMFWNWNFVINTWQETTPSTNQTLESIGQGVFEILWERQDGLLSNEMEQLIKFTINCNDQTINNTMDVHRGGPS
jgi:hypothetical protein